VDISKSIWWIVKMYMPPKDNDPIHLRRYYMAQSVGVLGIWAVAWVTAFWLVGKVPWVPQVAWAADVATLTTRIDRVDNHATITGNRISAQVDQVSQELKAFRIFTAGNNIWLDTKDQCKLGPNSAGMREEMERKIEWEMNEYFALAGKPYTRPPCDVFK
jgi:hypothetical protein